MRIDWSSWETRHDKGWEEGAWLDLRTGAFVAGPGVGEEVRARPELYLDVDHYPRPLDSRHERGLLHEIKDPALRAAALARLRLASENARHWRGYKDEIAALVADDPVVGPLWSRRELTAWFSAAERLGLWHGLRSDGLDPAEPPWRAEVEALERHYLRRWQAVLVDRLAFIEGWLASNAPLTHASLRPGATEAELASVERTLDVRLPLGLRALWSWRNGSSNELANFFDEHVLVSTDQALATRDMMNGLLRDGHFTDRGASWWQPSWLPLFSNGSGDAYCVDLRSAKRGRPLLARSEVVDFLHDDGLRSVLFYDVDELIDSFADELAANRWEGGRGWPVPVDPEWQVVHRHAGRPAWAAR